MILALALVLAQVDAGAAADELVAPPVTSDAPVADVDAGTPAPVVLEDVPPPPMMTAAEAPAPAAGFVKGELSVYLGSDRLSVKRNRVGVSIGGDYFLNVLYTLVEPQVDLRFFDSKLGIGIGVPLRIEIFSFQNLFRRAGTIRKEDYDTFHDFGRILKYVNYGKKEDNFYVNIGQRYATSIGHGTIMRRYAPNIDVDYPRVSAEVDYYNDYAGFEAFTNDVLEWSVISAIAFVKPFSFFKPQNLLLKTLSVGVTGALDRNAPSSIIYDPNTGARSVTSDNRIAANTAPLGLVGVDAEVKVLKTENVDIKPYVDYSMIVGGGGGFTAGALGRFNFGRDPVNAFRVVVEARYLDSRYQPSYFDTFYEIDRYQARINGTNRFGIYNYLTKRESIVQQGLGTRGGLYAELSWGIPNVIGLTVAFEAVTNSDLKNFVAHFELPWLNFLQIFGSFYKRGFKNVEEFAKADENSVLFAGLRLRTLPFLFINGRVYKTFRVNNDAQRYDNQFGFSIDVELGFEFGRSRAEAEELQKNEPPPPVEPTPATEGPPPTPAAEPGTEPAAQQPVEPISPDNQPQPAPGQPSPSPSN
ncbi:MAG: hypothetical protein JNK82_33560 [Myxococcaceae bacterium]|nr:hypothetical protein [Myxococcaceae bacterium]